MPMKRPAAAQGGSQPKKKAGEPGKLTAEALENHKKFIQAVEEKTKNGGIDQEGFEEALGQLDPSVSQALWKAFEQSRKACGQEELYKNECNGVGGAKKKRQLLRAWIMDKQSCGQTYRQSQHTMGLLKTQGVKEKYITKEEALTKWGKDELAQRLASGTIHARRCPQDKRFWEFKSVTQQGSCMAQSNKSTSYKTGEEKVKKASLMDFENLQLEDLHESDLDIGDEPQSPEEEEEHKALPDDLAKALGIKNPNQAKIKDAKPNAWELESRLDNATSTQEIKDKLVKFKSEITKDVATLEMKMVEVKKTCPDAALLKKVAKCCSSSTDLCDTLAKAMKDKKPKVESVKSSLQAALEALTQLKAMKTAVLKHQKASKK